MTVPAPAPKEPSLGDASPKRNPVDIDTHRILVSLFPNAAARTVTLKDVTLTELAALIGDAEARSKKALPWLKGARFGESRTNDGSLRHNANVIGFTLVNLDYDLEQISFDDAITQVRNAGFRALLYTSPSYTAEKPRWRVLLPTSRELPPEEHYGLARAAAARFSAVFGRESFTLSQAFLYGTARKIETAEGVTIDGTPMCAMLLLVVPRSGLVLVPSSWLVTDRARRLVGSRVHRAGLRRPGHALELR
jgi:hypothetical protein